MSQNSAKYLTQIAVLKKYPADSQITKQGDSTGYIFLIYSGSVKLFKSLNFRKAEGRELESMVRTPTSKDCVNLKEVFLEEVQQGFIIGGYEFFNDVAMQYTAVCSMPCQIFIFDKYIFEKIDAECVERFKMSLRPYVCDKMIKEEYFEGIRWKIYKKRLCRNIRIEKGNSKKEFLKGRGPLAMTERNLTLKNIKLPRIVPFRSKSQLKGKELILPK